MKTTHMILGAALTALAMLAGCQSTPPKMRDVELRGMYINGYSEMLALGYGRLTSIPGDKEALAAHYEEDTAWLRPDVKTHKIDIFMVGTNSAASSPQIIESICKAFAEVAPDLAKDAKSGCNTTTPLDVIKAGGEARKAVQLANEAAKDCADGSCAPATTTECADCTPASAQ